MILRPSIQNIKVVGYYLGKIIMGLSVFTAIPLVFAFFAREINPQTDFTISLCFTIMLGLLLEILCKTEREPNWMEGMIVVCLSWLAAMFLGAIPLFLSGHWKSYLDACFEAMSGFATTGLTLVNDLDHLSMSHNLWRHLIMFMGGQGIIIVALSFLVQGFSGAFRMYVGEARDEKVLPNVVSTSRFIWLVSVTYLVLGTLALGIVGTLEGMRPFNAFFHGACIFMAGFDTGGFAPQSQNILYYHSFPFEVVTISIMVLGAINFKLHYAVWTGNRKEIMRNIETVTFFITIMTTFLIVAWGLVADGTYPGVISVFRKGFYQLISGHTGTGFMTIYAMQFVKEWGALALAGIIIAMGLGGAACSTTGGIKMVRIGIACKALIQDIKRIMVPESAVVVSKFHHIKSIVLEDKQVRSVLIILLSYLILYGLGGLMGMALGYPFWESLFESTSAAANVGLSCGITQPSMPALLKWTYIVQMWVGRLEFMSVFTLIGFFVSAIKGK